MCTKMTNKDFKEKKIKIAFILPNLGGGGAERTILNLCSNLNREKFEITLILGKKKGEYIKFLPSDIEIFDLRVNHVMFSLSKLLKLIKKIKPDIIFSTLTHMNIVVLLLKYLFSKNIKIIIREANFFSTAYKESRNLKAKILPFFIKLLYNKANKIIFLSKGMSEDFYRVFSNYIEKPKMLVIPNPINIRKIDELKYEDIHEQLFEDGNKRIIAIGRLTKQKGYKYLLDAVSLIIREISNIKLLILGEGEDRKFLEEYAKKIGVSKYVCFCGFKSNPYKYLAHSDVFVLASLWEGFGNVILEAMACGIPVVATDCPSGPREIISHMEDGLLVPVRDAKSLATAIIELLRNESLREKLVTNAFKKVGNFDVDKIVNIYEKLFEEVFKS